jgi:hypothetical protein
MSLNQHGFMKNRSTITFLVKYASFVLNSIEDRNQVDSIYTDFLKAFDRVRHQLLLDEMSVGIEPATCMSGRTQKIWIGGAVSKDIKVTSGVPHTLLRLVFQQNIVDFRLRTPCTLLRRWNEALSSCQWTPGLFENSVGSIQTVRVVRQKLIAPQRW